MPAMVCACMPAFVPVCLLVCCAYSKAIMTNPAGCYHSTVTVSVRGGVACHGNKTACSTNLVTTLHYPVTHVIIFAVTQSVLASSFIAVV